MASITIANKWLQLSRELAVWMSVLLGLCGSRVHATTLFYSSTLVPITDTCSPQPCGASASSLTISLTDALSNTATGVFAVSARLATDLAFYSVAGSISGQFWEDVTGTIALNSGNVVAWSFIANGLVPELIWSASSSSDAGDLVTLMYSLVSQSNQLALGSFGASGVPASWSITPAPAALPLFGSTLALVILVASRRRKNGGLRSQ